MKVKEAKELLAQAPRTSTKWKANPVLTCEQAVGIVERGLAEKDDDEILDSLYEKRVHQVVKNQRCPRY